MCCEEGALLCVTIFWFWLRCVEHFWVNIEALLTRQVSASRTMIGQSIDGVRM